MADRNSEVARARARAWYYANKEKAAESGRAYVAANRESVRDYKRCWFDSNRDVNMAKARSRYWDDREAVLARRRDYYRQNREAVILRVRERENRQIAATQERATHSGLRWSASEDSDALLDGLTNVEKAFMLGRTSASVTARRVLLRKMAATA